MMDAVYRKRRDGQWLLSRDVHTLSAVAEHPEVQRLGPCALDNRKTSRMIRS
jgi:hypothetical protein